MRKLMSIALGLIFVSFAFTAQATAVRRDPGDAFPWGMEMPFPWKGIQGTWSVYVDGEPTLFTFRTVQARGGTKQLDVIQFDGRTCEILAYGSGFEEDRVVRGLILTPLGAKNITIHVFSEAALKANKSEGDNTRARYKTYTVMNMSDFFQLDSYTYELRKVHSSYNGICTTKKRLSRY